MNQTLQCPNCKSDIPFNAQALIAGAVFECHTCKSKISISPESMNQAKKIYDKFNDLKNKISQK